MLRNGLLTFKRTTLGVIFFSVNKIVDGDERDIEATCPGICDVISSGKLGNTDQMVHFFERERVYRVGIAFDGV